MGNKIKSILIGRPLHNEAIREQKYGVLWGLPILSSDPISSVAYAGQQVLAVLLPMVGIFAYKQMGFITGATMGLLVLLILSYRQTIESYPNGGGAYIVAKDNLGTIFGVLAGAALSVDYILTVAVSVSSGVEQIVSGFESLKPYSVEISVAVVLLLMVGNLRGIRESSRIFGIPTYAFVFGMVVMLGIGIIRFLFGGITPNEVPQVSVAGITQPLMIILVLRAFSNGCTALTGVEAVSNAVPNFKHPSRHNAKKVLVILAGIVLVLISGTAFLAIKLHVLVGDGHPAILIQLAEKVFGIVNGHGSIAGLFMYYYIMATSFIILVMAANTAYSGFPLLVSIMAREGYAPRQLSMRGDRLSYSNGIIALSVTAALLIAAFNAKVDHLIGLYAIGVFISFTLSQSGMFMKWLRQKGKGWPLKALVNGLGAFVTAVVVVVIAIFKFEEGAWIVVILIPVLIFLMLRVKRHYTAVAKQLRIPDETFATLDISKDHYRNRVIVPMDSITQASVRALRFAKTISDNVTAFSVATDEESETKLRTRWNKLHTDIPYIIKYSPYRRVVEPLLEFIKSAEYDYRKGDMITVILPQFSVHKLWNRLLHNRTRIYIERQLLKHKHIVVAVMPFQLKDDKTAIGEDFYMD
jgi:amino acid transporter